MFSRPNSLSAPPSDREIDICTGGIIEIWASLGILSFISAGHSSLGNHNGSWLIVVYMGVIVSSKGALGGNCNNT